MNHLNVEVTKYLNDLNHPLLKEINYLRKLIIETNNELIESYKWNAPNYSLRGQDRITLRIQPPKQVQIIFHRGAKKTEQPIKKIIEDSTGILIWKENDRALATFKNLKDIEIEKDHIKEIVLKWLAVK